MKLRLIIILICLANWGCSVHEVSKVDHIDFKSIIGTYEYIKDSVINFNPRFQESIEFNSDSSFLYVTRIGSFVRWEITGDWKLQGNKIILNDPKARENQISERGCDLVDDKYRIDVRRFDGSKIGYSLKINNSELLRDLNGSSNLNLKRGIKNIQVVTTSGLHSEKLTIYGEAHCFRIQINHKRTFINEEWTVLKAGLKPNGLDRNPAQYILYKTK